MDSFESSFISSFATATLKNSLVTLVGLREVDSCTQKSNEILSVIEDSKDTLLKYLPWVYETDLFDIQKRIRSWVLNEQFGQGGCWLIYQNAKNALAGAIAIDITLRNRSATISYWLSKRFTGQGLMTSSVALVADYVFSKLNLNRLELSVSIYNKKSAAVAKRCHFTQEGVCRDFEFINGQFVNHIRFSLLARDVNNDSYDVYLSKR